MDGFAVVYRANGMPEAELIKGYLESGDIPVDLEYESAGPVYGLTLDGLGEVRVCVPAEYEEEARLALARLSESGLSSGPSFRDRRSVEPHSAEPEGPEAA